MNSVFVNPGIYSCAVDAFLEISMHLFFHIYQIYLLGMILQTCLFTLCLSFERRQFIIEGIRELVWSYIIDS